MDILWLSWVYILTLIEPMMRIYSSMVCSNESTSWWAYVWWYSVKVLIQIIFSNSPVVHATPSSSFGYPPKQSNGLIGHDRVQPMQVGSCFHQNQQLRHPNLIKKYPMLDNVISLILLSLIWPALSLLDDAFDTLEQAFELVFKCFELAPFGCKPIIDFDEFGKWVAGSIGNGLAKRSHQAHFGGIWFSSFLSFLVVLVSMTSWHDE